uniref:hypothetical protein n=1 Tax=Prevotella sp. TaxID=59823 RepID=UPI003FF10B99
MDSVQKIIGEKGKSFLLRRKKCIFATAKSLEKVAEQNKKSLEKRAWIQEKSLEKRVHIENNTS